MAQGSSDASAIQPDPGNLTRYPDRFYLPECWTRPISIEGADLDHLTNHSLRKDSTIQTWQVGHAKQASGMAACPAASWG